jgi:AP-3 complex subunit delta-1
MFGFDISWAAFQSVEAMSVHTFSQKRIGYLVATQAIKRNADVVLLTTNLFKKDLASVDSPFESGIAMNCLSNICTPELARDLASDVVALMNNNRHLLFTSSFLVTPSLEGLMFVSEHRCLRTKFL